MRLVFKLSVVTLFLVVSANVASAQYVVSAKAGLVNYVERYRSSPTTITHPDGTKDTAHVGYQLENGDIVETHGRIEILLNPGSMIRLERGSTLKVVESKLSDMHFDLDSGVAMVEASNDVGQKKDILLQIKTPQATFNIAKMGVYELSAVYNGSTIAKVEKGETEIHTTEGKDLELKAGHEITIGADSTVAENKLDKKSSTDFELWGQDRAESLAMLNDRIDIRDTLMGQPLMPFSGMWFFSPFYGNYMYMPFGNFYQSPYGFWYDAYYNPYYWGNRYGVVYTTGVPVTNVPANGAVGGGVVKPGTTPTNPGAVIHNPGSKGGPTVGSARTTTRVSPGPTHNVTSSFTRGGGGSMGGFSGGSGGSGGGSGSSNSTSVTRSSAPPPSAPSTGSSHTSGGSSGGAGAGRKN